jgi:hypothetical protein
MAADFMGNVAVQFRSTMENGAARLVGERRSLGGGLDLRAWNSEHGLGAGSGAVAEQKL